MNMIDGWDPLALLSPALRALAANLSRRWLSLSPRIPALEGGDLAQSRNTVHARATEMMSSRTLSPLHMEIACRFFLALPRFSPAATEPYSGA